MAATQFYWTRVNNVINNLLHSFPVMLVMMKMNVNVFVIKSAYCLVIAVTNNVVDKDSQPMVNNSVIVFVIMHA